LQDVLLRVDRAYHAFFRRRRADETPGYPPFQSRTRYQSYTYPHVGEHGGARLDTGFLVPARIGRIGVRWSRPVAGMPKTVALSQEADGWFVCCSSANVPNQPLPPTGRATGIDVGLQVVLATADGATVANPRHSRRGEKRLAKAQRRVSRRKKGSKRRKKAVVLLARAQQHVTRQRADHHHTPQDRAGAVARVRHHLSRRCAGRQSGAESPPGQEPKRCRVGTVPQRPHFQGSVRR
jgi:putative transposase